MSATGQGERDDWVARVLGFDVDTPLALEPTPKSAAGETEFKQAYAAWIAADSRVRAQIQTLADKLGDEDDAAFEDVGDYLVRHLIGPARLSLLRALGKVDPADPERRGTGEALAAVAAFRAHLDGNLEIAACESNPWEVPVVIGDVLSPALDHLERALKPSGRAP